MIFLKVINAESIKVAEWITFNRIYYNAWGLLLKVEEKWWLYDIREKAGTSLKITNETFHLFLSMLLLNGCHKLPDHKMYKKVRFSVSWYVWEYSSKSQSLSQRATW